MSVRLMIWTLVVVFSAGQLWAQQHPIIGTWKTNPDKSKVLLGGPGISQVVTYKASGPDGIKYTSHRTNADGKPVTIEFTAKLDGKTYPYQDGGGARDGIALTPINDHSIRVAYMQGGETVRINYWIVSPDGKALTTISTGGNPVVARMAVHDRQ